MKIDYFTLECAFLLNLLYVKRVNVQKNLTAPAHHKRSSVL